MTIKEIDILKIEDGKYYGEYKKHRWFYELQVDVKANHIDTIVVIRSAIGSKKINKELIKKTIEHQSLQIDAVSGATIGSKTYLKAVENALSISK